MPSVLRISGPTFERQGQVIQPRALVSFCEDCGASAPFGITNKDGKLQTYCGFIEDNPKCLSSTERNVA